MEVKNGLQQAAAAIGQQTGKSDAHVDACVHWNSTAGPGESAWIVKKQHAEIIRTIPHLQNE
jgi:hypothetical protein